MLDMNQMQSNTPKDKMYLLRFVAVHEGEGGGHEETEAQAHYFGYVCNFASTQWFKLDDNDVDEVREEDVLKNSQVTAYQLYYVLMGSEEYHQCYQEDLSFCSVSSPIVTNPDTTVGVTDKTATSEDLKTGKETNALS